MSFLKKLLGTQDKTPEELEADRIKKMEKQEEMKRQEELRKQEFEEKQRERDAKKSQEKALQEKYIGLGFGIQRLGQHHGRRLPLIEDPIVLQGKMPGGQRRNRGPGQGVGRWG